MTIVTSTYRYKRPPPKRTAAPLEGPAIVRSGRKREEVPHAATLPEPANDVRKPAIVTAKKPRGRKSAVVDDGQPDPEVRAWLQRAMLGHGPAR